MFFNRIFILIFLSCLGSVCYSQDPDYETLKIIGRVIENDKALENQAIIVFENNKQIDTLYSKRNGKFEYILTLNKYYTLVFPEKNASYSSLVIDTKIPEDFFYLPIYKCIIRMDQDFEDDLVEKSRYEDFPIGIVKYDNENLRFELDYHYFRSRIKEVK